MSYKVIRYFTDLQDNDHPYNVGDTFPRDGLNVTAERAAELASRNNAQKTPLIVAVDTDEEKPKAKRTKKPAQKQGGYIMLDNLKLMLGIPADDTGRDNLLNLIISMATARLKGLLGGIEPPAELDHIVLDVSIARYNRIGSEGLASHTVEGESLAFADNDFAPFMDEIETFLAAQSESALGKVKFL